MHSRDESVHAITVRLPGRLLAFAKRSARHRSVSLNAFVRLALERMAAEERDARLRASYDALGSDDETNVERFFKAQRQAVRRG